jgi:adenylate cyclase
MPWNLEIERKYLVKRLPRVSKRGSPSRIVQGYFPFFAQNVEIRLRRKDSQHFITLKAGRGVKRFEKEIKIPKSKFQALWPLTRGARISKSRYRIVFGNRTIELDVYDGPHRGLVTADVEFDSLQASRSFRPPAWIAREITGLSKYSNRVLARHRGLPSESSTWSR